MAAGAAAVAGELRENLDYMAHVHHQDEGWPILCGLECPCDSLALCPDMHQRMIESIVCDPAGTGGPVTIGERDRPLKNVVLFLSWVGIVDTEQIAQVHDEALGSS